MKKLDNRGSSLVLVMVVFAIVSILSVTALATSVYNLQMKGTDKNVKDSFYSAEAVLDQISVGLQGDVSDAYKYAYKAVMENYNSLLMGAGSESQAALRQDKFNKLFLNKLTDALAYSQSMTQRYNLAKLIGYVSTDIITNGAVDDTKPHAKIEATSAAAANPGAGLLNSYYPTENKIVIKGLKITYTDVKGYTSIIETDIALFAPDLNLVNAGEMPDTFSYSIIGNRGVDMMAASGNIDIAGSVYSGSNFVLDNTRTTDEDILSLNVQNGVNVRFENLKYLIAQGTIDIDGGSTSMQVAPDSQVWTENIKVQSSNLSLYGSTYISDDLTLSGDNPVAVLGSGSSGRYVGYGNGSSAAQSSAIIVNGKNSKLDMSGLMELFVAGYAYVNTGKIVRGNGANGDVGMASSISVKGEQIAYLIPGKCIGVDNEGESFCKRNPITYSDYNEIINNSNKYTEVDGNIEFSDGKRLNDYLDPGQKLSDCVSTVFVPARSGIESDGLVYYYISLSEDKAQKYYEEFFDNNTDRLELYADFYADVIKTNPSATVYTAGKYSLYENGKLSLLPENNGNRLDSVSIASEIAEVNKRYTSLRTTLKSEGATSEQLAKTVYQNIVDEAKLTEVTNSASNNRVIVSYTSPSGGSERYSAILANNGGAHGYELDLNSVISGAAVSNPRIVVASGDVLVNCDFNGTIISNGKITIQGSHKIENANISQIKKLMSADIDASNKLYNVFISGESYLTSAGNSGALELKVTYDDIITYQNWKKE